MLRNYKSATYETQHYYELCFDDGHNNGFGFPCDAEGKLLPDLPSAAVENYNFCMAHPEKFDRWNKVVKHSERVRINATGTCICGETFELWNQYMGACECPKCGRWYNLYGQELNPPETWEDGDDW